MTDRFGLGSKRIAIVLWSVLVLMLAAVAYDVYKAVTGDFNSITFDYWLRSSIYGRVQPGMTKKEISLLLGKPHDSGLNPWYKVWDYNLPPNPKGNSHTYVVDGYAWDSVSVHFDPHGKVTDEIESPVEHILWPKGGPKHGMTMQQVRKLAGEPDDISDYSAAYYELWNYRLWNGTGFSILLDRNGRVIRTQHVVSRASFSG